MDDTPSDEFDRQIHGRLLDRDPVASAELAKAHLVPLRNRLRVGFPNVEESLLWDAAADAILGYAEHPERFDPSRSPLSAYLGMAARGDLLNALDREMRRSARLVPLESVEESLVARNPDQEVHDIVVLEADQQVRSLGPAIMEAIPDDKDRQLVALLIAGERKTEPFSAVLGLTHLSAKEQRREVKKHKDRLKKRLERLGGKTREQEK